jgi:hypothetical protein
MPAASRTRAISVPASAGVRDRAARSHTKRSTTAPAASTWVWWATVGGGHELGVLAVRGLAERRPEPEVALDLRSPLPRRPGSCATSPLSEGWVIASAGSWLMKLSAESAVGWPDGCWPVSHGLTAYGNNGIGDFRRRVELEPAVVGAELRVGAAPCRRRGDPRHAEPSACRWDSDASGIPSSTLPGAGRWKPRPTSAAQCIGGIGW